MDRALAAGVGDDAAVRSVRVAHVDLVARPRRGRRARRRRRSCGRPGTSAGSVSSMPCVFVTCSTSLPSGFITHRSSPERVGAVAGEQDPAPVGRPGRPADPRCRPAGRRAESRRCSAGGRDDVDADRLRVRCRNAGRRSRSRRATTTGCASNPLVIRRRRSWPSAPMTQMPCSGETGRPGPRRRTRSASRRATTPASPLRSASSTSAGAGGVPFAFIVQRSSCLKDRTKTMRFPFGEYEGSSC